MAMLKVLAVAAASGRVAYVYFVGEKLKDWHISDAAAKSPVSAAQFMQKWINQLKPDVVVTEKMEQATKKGASAKGVISAIARTAEHNYLLDVSIVREQDFANKYAEATAIAERYPELKPWLPTKRRFFDNEPRNTVLFEAIAMAEKVRRGSTEQLAAAMG